jgi:hypothetical protein
MLQLKSDGHLPPPGGLFPDDHANLNASILGVGVFVVALNGGTIGAVAIGVEIPGAESKADEIFADGLGAAFTERAIIFGRAALVGMAGEIEFMAGIGHHPLMDLLELASFRTADIRGVEGEIDRVGSEGLIIDVGLRIEITAIRRRDAATNIISRQISGGVISQSGIITLFVVAAGGEGEG